MTPAQHERAKELFAALVSLSPDARADYLVRNSADDLEVRAEVERLLGVSATNNEGLGEVGRAVAAGLAAGPRSRDRAEMVGRSIVHYTIERLLGAGGMGEVYLAQDRALGRQVALKILPADFHSSLRERLLREAWANARVQHPGIATFFDAGHAGDVDYIAMEYVAGQTLRDRLRSGPLPVDEAITIAAGLLEALVHAHYAGVLHRDIKPENIVLAATGSAKLLDFGLAKAAVSAGEAPAAAVDTKVDTLAGADRYASAFAPDASAGVRDHFGAVQLTRAGTVLGTIGYMAPEQLAGGEVDQRADVFAVGAVLYEMLSGAPAFPGRTQEERVEATRGADPAPLAGHGLLPALDRIVRRALSRDREDRYGSASAFHSALREFGGERTLSSHPVTLAVLDFRSDPSLASLSTTLVESLGSMLRSVRGLGMVPAMRMTALGPGFMDRLSPQEIGLRLGCSMVLTGSLHAEGEGVMLDTQLLEVASGAHRLVESMSGTPVELTGGLERLAVAVARALGREPPARTIRPGLEAEELYARGRRLGMTVGRSAIVEACELLERAVALEPAHAPALATLAMTHAFRFNFDSDPQHLEREADFARRAIARNSGLIEALIWGGYALSNLQRFAEANDLLRRAAELEQANYMGPYFRAGPLFSARRFEDLEGASDPDDPPLESGSWARWRNRKMTALLQKAVQLNPTSPWAWGSLAWFLLEERQYDEAGWCLGRAIELEPRSFPPISGLAGILGECLRRSGRPEEGRVQFLRGLDAVERTDHMYRDTFRGLFLTGLGRAAMDQGDRVAAGAAFQQVALQLRGRSKARCAGQVLVQALAGWARTGGGKAALEEALDLIGSRTRFDFSALWCANDGIALWDLHVAANELGLTDTAAALFRRAFEAGSTEAQRAPRERLSV